MLKRLSVSGFKSLRGVSVELPALTVLFGPNAAGKSNLLDALHTLSRVGGLRTLADALDPLSGGRGHAFEAFTFPAGGLPELLDRPRACFTIQADLAVDAKRYRYRISPEIDLATGRLGVSDEYLTLLKKNGAVKGAPAIERVDDELRVRRKGKPGRPRTEPVGINHALLSDRSLGGNGYAPLRDVRRQIANWRVHYLDPRTMRVPRPPSDVLGIGESGHQLVPFLYKLKADDPYKFESVTRMMCSLVPNIQGISVELDSKRGTLDLTVRQSGIDYSSRMVSEGTLRVLALCAIVMNPWAGSLVALEEPENGVHPRRIELIAELLLGLTAEWGRQLLVTTHSPLFCEAVIRMDNNENADVGLFNVRSVDGATAVERFRHDGLLFRDREIAAALESSEDGFFGKLIARGFVDE